MVEKKLPNSYTYTLQFPMVSDHGIQRWAIPHSLAVTKGILVSFFSSA